MRKSVGTGVIVFDARSWRNYDADRSLRHTAAYSFSEIGLLTSNEKLIKLAILLYPAVGQNHLDLMLKYKYICEVQLVGFYFYSRREVGLGVLIGGFYWVKP